MDELIVKMLEQAPTVAALLYMLFRLERMMTEQQRQCYEQVQMLLDMVKPPDN